MRSNGAHRIHKAFPAVLALAGMLALGGGAAAQSMEGPGLVSAGLLLRQMHGVKRVLMIGAHPDDEDTSLLTTLARGWGAETAYLSLTRGDGGQNLIGPELFEGLGIIRTGELEAARSLDGATQYFTRAFDYGFSKSADEAFSFWPREELLSDVVWVIRRFRPQVVVSVWTGTPRDGHGQHQASGIIAKEAFAAAGDPTRFPEQLAMGVEAWTPEKLYESARGRGGASDQATLLIQTGDLDPLLGRSLYQLSMESRSQHRSQDQGSPQAPGPHATGVRQLQGRATASEGFFAGVDTTLVGLTGGLSGGSADPQAVRRDLEAYERAVDRAQSDFGLDASSLTSDVVDALGELRSATDDLGDAGGEELRAALETKRTVAARAFAAAAGISFDVRAERDLVVPGETVQVRAMLWNGGDIPLTRPDVRLAAPSGWRVDRGGVDGLAPDGGVAPGSLITWTFDVHLPADADPSRLYYLKKPRLGAMYQWPEDGTVRGLPRDPAPVDATVSFVPAPSGAPVVELSSPWRYVGVDRALGQYHKTVLVVPAVSVRVTPEGLVWPQSRTEARSVSVVVHTESEKGSRGELSVKAPAGWSVTPPSQSYALPQAGSERTLTFQVRPDGTAEPGEHVLGFAANDQNGRSYTEGYTLIDYPHIEQAALYRPAEAHVTVVPVRVAQGLRVGYIMGSGDDGPEAIRQLGADVELLSEDQVREGDFDDFRTIVLGIRAYETRPDLVAASEQLLDFARNGGTVIAQYNRIPLDNLVPRPLTVSRSAPRVTDETAPVRILAPDAPVFTTPNRIGPSDFAGWVQERGLYFAADWDPGWVPLLEMNDPGEAPLRGSLLVTSVGKGVYVYTGVAFFREWADRVPGAYRLFANLISLDPAQWRAFEAKR